MWWVAPLIGAGVGAYLGKQQQKAAEDARKEQALINMYAPLFGKAPTAVAPRQDMVTPGALSGAMSAYGMGSQIQQQGKLNALYDRQLANTANPNTTVQEQVFIPYQTYQGVDYNRPPQQQGFGYNAYA